MPIPVKQVLKVRPTTPNLWPRQTSKTTAWAGTLRTLQFLVRERSPTLHQRPRKEPPKDLLLKRLRTNLAGRP